MRVGLLRVHQRWAAGDHACQAGEAQRVKLSKELSKRSTGRMLCIFWMNHQGLHFEDVRKPAEVPAQSLVDQGNSVGRIEHNLDVITQTADYISTLGPKWERWRSGGSPLVRKKQVAER